MVRMTIEDLVELAKKDKQKRLAALKRTPTIEEHDAADRESLKPVREYKHKGPTQKQLVLETVPAPFRLSNGASIQINEDVKYKGHGKVLMTSYRDSHPHNSDYSFLVVMWQDDLPKMIVPGQDLMTADEARSKAAFLNDVIAYSHGKEHIRLAKDARVFFSYCTLKEAEALLTRNDPRGSQGSDHLQENR